MSDSTDARILLSILRRDWGDAEQYSQEAGSRDASLARLAKSCDVHPTVHAILEENDRFDLVSAAAREELIAMRRKCRMDNLLLLAVLEEVLDLLSSRGIAAVALKGVAVIHRFGDRFDSRSMDDIDLLVSPEHVEPALAALEAAGYTVPGNVERAHWLRSSFEMPVYSRGPVPVLVEIHWGLGQEVRYSIPIDDVRKREVPIDIAGRRCSRLDDHDAVAHLLLHHVQHYFDRRLKWMLDLRRIATQPGFSWTTVCERVTRWRGSVAAGMALLHVRKLFPDAATAAAVSSIPSSRWRRTAMLPFRSGHPLDWYRGTRNRAVQLAIAAILLEHARELPAYLRHRQTRDDDATSSAVERTP